MKTKLSALLAAGAFLAFSSSAAKAATVEQVAVIGRGVGLEAIAENPDGSLWITSNFDKKLLHISRDGKALGDIVTPLSTQVVVRGAGGELVVTGHERLPAGIMNTLNARGGGAPREGGPPPAAGAAPPPAAPAGERRGGGPGGMNVVGLGTGIAVYGADGKLRQEIRGPQDSFFNGIAELSPGVFIVADSIGGKLWRYDLAKNAVTPWLTDVSIEGPGGKPAFGGSNGLKVHKGYVYYTSRGSMWRAKVGKNGEAKGKPEEFAKLGGDDFDFGKDDYIYIPQGQDLMKISPKGEISKVVTLGFAAPTARFASDGKLYLVTRGMPAADGGAPESKLARVTLP